MSVQTVRFRTTPERLPAVVQHLDGVFAALHAAAPAPLQYTALLDVDPAVFTLILELPGGAENPLPAIAAAADFREALPTYTDDDPTPRACTVVGRYSA